MSETLILLFHRDLTRSKANAALSRAAAAVDGVKLIDMQARYPDGVIDIATHAEVEAAMLLAADRIVLQFPIQWYSTPALLKAWQDAVLTRMYYIFAEVEGNRLIGTPMMIAATAGNVPEAYARDGVNRYSVDDLLTPLKATAHRCGLPWHDPYLVFAADELNPSALDAATVGYVRAIEDFIATTPNTTDGATA